MGIQGICLWLKAIEVESMPVLVPSVYILYHREHFV